jgi:hypothetical protein
VRRFVWCCLKNDLAHPRGGLARVAVSSNVQPSAYLLQLLAARCKVGHWNRIAFNVLARATDDAHDPCRSADR